MFKWQFFWSKKEFDTVHNECSEITPSVSTPLRTRVRRPCIFLLSLSSFFFMSAGAHKIRAKNQGVVPTFHFVNSALRPSSTDESVTDLNAGFVRLCLSNPSESDTALQFCKKKGYPTKYQFYRRSKTTYLLEILLFIENELF